MRIRVLLAALLMLVPAVFLLAASADQPPIPMTGLFGPGIGRCVALSEGDILLGITINRTENMAKQAENPAGFAISTYNAVAMIAQESKRPDIASLAVDLEIRSGEYNAEAHSLEPDSMVCYCENTIWEGRVIVGCGGSCGSCTHCYVRPMIR